MRRPLEAIKDGWLEAELSFSNSVKWIDDLIKTLSILQGQARKHEGRYKSIAKQYYDKKTKDRSFPHGDMVLLHDPTTTGKLNSISEDPYEVRVALSKTLYKISVPN